MRLWAWKTKPNFFRRKDLPAASVSANVAMAAVALQQRRSGASNEPLLFSKVALDPDQRTRVSELRAHLVARRDEHARHIGELAPGSPA
jgi:hypothetical protein